MQTTATNDSGHVAVPAESTDPRFARFEPAPQRELYSASGRHYSALDALNEVSRKLDQSIAAFDKAKAKFRDNK